MFEGIILEEFKHNGNDLLRRVVNLELAHLHKQLGNIDQSSEFGIEKSGNDLTKEVSTDQL
jgi:hypothetical protein